MLCVCSEAAIIRALERALREKDRNAAAAAKDAAASVRCAFLCITCANAITCANFTLVLMSSQARFYPEDNPWFGISGFCIYDDLAYAILHNEYLGRFKYIVNMILQRLRRLCSTDDDNSNDVEAVTTKSWMELLDNAQDWICEWGTRFPSIKTKFRAKGLFKVSEPVFVAGAAERVVVPLALLLTDHQGLPQLGQVGRRDEKGHAGSDAVPSSFPCRRCRKTGRDVGRLADRRSTAADHECIGKLRALHPAGQAWGAARVRSCPAAPGASHAKPTTD